MARRPCPSTAALPARCASADRIDHAFQRRRIGDAQVTVIARLDAARRQSRLDLRPRAERQHQAHAEAVQQHQVVDDVGEVGMLQAVARQHDDKVRSRCELM